MHLLICRLKFIDIVKLKYRVCLVLIKLLGFRDFFPSFLGKFTALYVVWYMGEIIWAWSRTGSVYIRSTYLLQNHIYTPILCLLLFLVINPLGLVIFLFK